MIRNLSQIRMELCSRIENTQPLLPISIEDFNSVINRYPFACAETISVDGSIEDLIRQLSQCLMLMKNSMWIADVMLCLVCRKGTVLTISDLCQIKDSIKKVVDTAQSYRFGYAESNLPDVKRLEVLIIASGLWRNDYIQSEDNADTLELSTCITGPESQMVFASNGSLSLEQRAATLMIRYIEGELSEDDFAKTMFLLTEEIRSRYMILGNSSTVGMELNPPYWLIDFVENHYRPWARQFTKARTDLQSTDSKRINFMFCQACRDSINSLGMELELNHEKYRRMGKDR